MLCAVEYDSLVCDPEPEPPDPEPPELEPPELLDPELLELPPLDPELLDPVEPPFSLFALVETDPVPFPKVVLFPIPSPVSSLVPILAKLENIGLSLLVIPYATTAAAIHKTIIMEIIIFALSNFSPHEKLV